MIDILSGQRRGLWPGLLLAGLAAASVPYAAAMRVRRWAYASGVLKGRRVACPVICVGNVTTGGTGKTPMVAWVVSRLLAAGKRPAVLIRGYRSSGGVSDEARVLEQTVGAGVPVVVNADRVAGAAEAVARGADVLVMDDGFQHLRLRRDLDIVLIDASNPFGFGHCLPRGLLREPLSALRAAGAVVVTHCELADPAELARLRERIALLAPQASISLAEHAPAGLECEGQKLPADALAGKKAFAFCGIGNPEGFCAMLRRCGLGLAGQAAFPDHVDYAPAVVADLSERIRQTGAEVAVTTAKDRVKLQDASALPVPLWTLGLEFRVVEGEDELAKAVAGAIACPADRR